MTDDGWTLRIPEARLDQLPREKAEQLEAALAGQPFVVGQEAGTWTRVVQGTGDPPAIVVELAIADAERARVIIRAAVRKSGSLYPDLSELAD